MTTLKRCEEVAKEITPIRLQVGMYVAPYDIPIIHEGPLKFAPSGCSASLTEVDLSYHFDEGGIVGYAEGEKIIYDVQKSDNVRRLKKDIKKVNGCKFTEFHSHSTPAWREQEASPENHIHFECKGPYKSDEWRNALNRLVAILNE